VDNYRSQWITEPEPESRTTVIQIVIDLIQTVILAVVLFVGINALSARIRVDSVSMQPTLFENDFVLVNRLAYKLGSPQRGDVIVFKYPPDPQQTPYIKRVIGLPGDRIRIADGKVYVNEVVLTEPYLKVTTRQGGEYLVPPDSLFVMGDNRNNSSDSRAWGMVPISYVIGKAEVTYWPPDHWAVLHFPSAVAASP
jgi:signal peptidase I